MIVDEAAVRQLVERGLVDSAEYWASLLVSEKQLSHEQQLSRLSLYADVLFKNRKYKQAILSYERVLYLCQIPPRQSKTNEIELDTRVHLSDCVFLSSEEKEDRLMIRKCIQILEGIDKENRTVDVNNRLAKYYWMTNHYQKAADCAECVLQEEPYAVEAIQILSRIQDFKGMKEVAAPLPSLSDDTIEHCLLQAEYNQFSNPQLSLQLYQRATSHFLPSPLLYSAVASCYFSLHQFPPCFHWLSLLRSVDPANAYAPLYLTASLLSHAYSISLPFPPIVYDEEQVVRWRREQPFSLPLMILNCFAKHQQELLTLEQSYWDIINYYPSYASYSLLLSFYIDESMTAKALSLANSIHKNNPDHFYANLLLAKVYLAIPTAAKQAESVLKRCHEEKKTHAEAGYLYGKVLAERKDYKRAIEVLKSVLKEDSPRE
ncbi:hypothetical protein WA556_002278, partial [Blastocystis sp. ATCC 50177/Nand II]